MSYNGSLTAEQFLFREMRVFSKLYIENKSIKEIIDHIQQGNLFQYPTEREVSRLARACYRRITALCNEKLAWELANAPVDIAKQINLYAMMRYSRLAREFMIDLIGEKYRQHDFSYTKRDIHEFFTRLRVQNDDVAAWSEKTIMKLKQVKFGARSFGKGFLFSSACMCGFGKQKNKLYILGLLNSVVSSDILSVLSPTLNFGAEQIRKIPYIERNSKIVDVFVDSNISLSRTDWDAFETSWDFKQHPLVCGPVLVGSSQKKALPLITKPYSPTLTIKTAYEKWEREAAERFDNLKANEEELNRIFIDIYGLQEELTPEVEDKDVTVRRGDLGRDIRSLISYAVGCMFGRYSPYKDGLIYAGGKFSDQWVVVSGQYFMREAVERYVCKELSRIDRLAEIDGSDGADLWFDEKTSERGNLCIVRSNAPGSSIDSVKYSRGTSKKLYKGIREIPFDCSRIKSGIGDAAFDLCSPEILEAIGNRSGAGLVDRGWEDADRVDWASIHYSLITNHYLPTLDNILPICDDEYFDDDIVARFIDFIRLVYSAESLEENLRFIAEALGGRGTSREIIRNYFLKDFYKDHCKIYQKRPIYWLFDSGKKNGFKALIYMHRYTPDLLARLRTDYVHEQQERYRTQLSHMTSAMVTATGSERARLLKQQNKLTDQLRETTSFEEKVHHLVDQKITIDLDNGVKKNYGIFGDVLAKI